MIERPKRSLARLFLHTLATIAIGQGAQILAGIVTARAFGPAGKGIISYAAVLIGFAVTTSEGVRTALSHQIGHEQRPARPVWGASIRILMTLVPLGALLFLVLWKLHPAQEAFLFVALAFPFAMYLQLINGLFLLRHRIERVNMQNAWTTGAGSALATVVAVLLFRANVTVVLVIWIAGFAAASFWASLSLGELLGPVVRAEPSAGLVSKQLVFGGKAALSATITLLALRVDVLIVGTTLPVAALGVYTLGVGIAELLFTFSRSITWATAGRITTDPLADAALLTARVVRVLLFVQTLAALGMYVVGPWAISFVYGARFAEAGAIMRIFLLRMIVYSVDGALSYFISVRLGRPGLLLIFESITLVSCGALTWFAIKPFGLQGAALADTLTFSLAVAIKIVYFMRKTGLGPLDVLLVHPDDIPEKVRVRLGVFVPKRLVSEGSEERDIAG